MGSPLVSLTILNMLYWPPSVLSFVGCDIHTVLTVCISSFSVYGQLKLKLQEWSQAFVLLAQEDPRLTRTTTTPTIISTGTPFPPAGKEKINAWR